MINHITAPAPRMLLRLFVLEKLFGKHAPAGTSLSKVCEIGPGLGDASSLTLERYNIERFDLYESAEAARELLATRFNLNAHVHLHGEFDVQPLQYDMTLCFEVVEHIDEDSKFMRGIFDSTAHGGRFYGSVPAYMKKWQTVDELAGHFRRYEHDELKTKLEEAGFVDVELFAYGFPLINLLFPWREHHYKKLLNKRTNHDMGEATAKSGISRGLAMSYNKRFVYSVVKLFSVFQLLPGLSKFGDGFVFSCRKP